MYHANTYCTTFFFLIYIAKQENKEAKSKQVAKN